MSSIINMVDDKKSIIFGNDNIVIRDSFETIRGGRSLDVTGYPLDTVYGGHVVIMEDSTNEYKPFPLISDGSAYDSLPAGHTIVGIVRATVSAKKPFVGIVIRGSVNPAASVVPMGNILDDVKAALPLITFMED